MKVTQMPPIHAANLVANSSNTAYRVDAILTCPGSNLTGLTQFLVARGNWATISLKHWICIMRSYLQIQDIFEYIFAALITAVDASAAMVSDIVQNLNC